MTVQPTRRRFIQASAALIPLLHLSGCGRSGAIAQGRDGTPFALGVASGEPMPDGFVIWTRLAPDPLAPGPIPGGMPDRPVEVGWTVARDEGFRDVVARGTARAVPADAHSVHVAVTGLEPARWYWYRFVADGIESPAGRSRTAPAPGAAVQRLRLATASCQQYEHGFFAAHRHMAADDLDLVLFLGDYIYEYSWGRNRVRHHGAPECRTLADYRARYALYKADADLQACHAALPWIVTWDDHEVSNNYGDAEPEPKRIVPGLPFLDRRAAGYKAYWEHMPLHPARRPDGPNLPLYRAFDFGRLARFMVLDDRQYRDRQHCPPDAGADCLPRRDPRRSLLGAAQERWLAGQLAPSPAQWNVLAQQTLMVQRDTAPGPERRLSADGWDGYRGARTRLLSHIAAAGVSDPLVLGGDIHCTCMADVKTDFDDPRAPVVASELTGTPISSHAPGGDPFGGENPHVRHVDLGAKGYLRVTLTPAGANGELRGLADVTRADSPIATLATAAIAAGRPGVTMA